MTGTIGKPPFFPVSVPDVSGIRVSDDPGLFRVSEPVPEGSVVTVGPVPFGTVVTGSDVTGTVVIGSAAVIFMLSA